MTHPGKDAVRLWFKQVPNNEINADGTWTQRLLADHHTVQRSRQPDHGQKALCPVCEAPGRFDSDPGQAAVFDDSIWINGKTGEPECVECALK